MAYDPTTGTRFLIIKKIKIFLPPPKYIWILNFGVFAPLDKQRNNQAGPIFYVPSKYSVALININHL